MPHWSCHYYRLETGSTFVVGSYSFSIAASLFAMFVYSAIILASLFAIVTPVMRTPVAIISGVMHLAFAALHAYRIVEPFRFEVLGYPWSHEASIREVGIVGLFGVFSIALGLSLRRRPKAYAISDVS